MQALLVFALSRQVLPLLVAGGALAAFACGYLGIVSPVFDLIAQFSAHWLVIALVAVAASFMTRFAYWILATSLPVACLTPAAITAWYAMAPVDGANNFSLRLQPVTAALAANRSASHDEDGVSAGNAQRRSFKLLTYNLYNYNTDLEAIGHEIERHDADIVVLVEFGPNKRALKPRLLRRYPIHKSCETNWDCAVAVFSRLPVAKFEMVLPHDDAGPPYIAAEIELGPTTVTVVGTHVLSPNHGPRANFIELDHLGRMAGRRSTPMVVAGDLNTTIWAHGFDNFRRKSGLIHMGHLIPTWPVGPLPLPQIGIDHVFASPELRITSVAAGSAAGSDHIPLVTTIELR